MLNLFMKETLYNESQLQHSGEVTTTCRICYSLSLEILNLAALFAHFKLYLTLKNFSEITIHSECFLSKCHLNL